MTGTYSFKPVRTSMTPIMPDRLNWASTIGLFLINFSTLDLFIQDYLQKQLSEEEFIRWIDQHFADRVARIDKFVQEPGFPEGKRQQFERWSSRLTPIREIRNHLAHGILRMTMDDDHKNWMITISLPRSLAGSHSLSTRGLTLKELLRASKELVDLIEEFKTWEGTWVEDGELTF